MMNFAPPAKKCSSGTLSPTPGAVLQIGSPQHFTLCYSLCHIAQTKSWRGDGIWSAESKVSKNGPKFSINLPGWLMFFASQGETFFSWIVKLTAQQIKKEGILLLIVILVSLIVIDHLCYVKIELLQQFTLQYLV